MISHLPRFRFFRITFFLQTMYEVLRRSTCIFLASILCPQPFISSQHYALINYSVLWRHRLEICPWKKEKVIYFFLFLIEAAAAGAWDPLQVTGTQPRNFRNIRNAGSWEPTTQYWFTSGNTSSSQSVLPTTQHQVHFPGLQPWVITAFWFGGSNPFSLWRLQSFCYLCNWFSSYKLLLLILKWVLPFWTATATQKNQCKSKTSSLPIITGITLESSDV